MTTPRRLIAGLVFILGLSAQAAMSGRAPECCSAPAGAKALHARFDELAPRLAASPLGRPLHIESRESDNSLRGEVFAVVNHPFDEVRDSLQRSQSWCEVMLLPFNTKACAADPAALHVYVGRKAETPIRDAFRVDFRYLLRAREPDYLNVALEAPEGPLGTHDYHIALEATAGEDGRTLLHFSYSYGFGVLSRVAMSTYLATTGASKVGFSRDYHGNFVGGVRGVVERNTMRYFLAIEAFLDTLMAPPGVRVEKRLREWFAATERYPRQLHEMDADEYLAMKRREYSRLAAG